MPSLVEPTTVILTRTFADKDGTGSSAAFDPTTVIARIYHAGALVETLTAGTDAAWVEAGSPTVGTYKLVYTTAGTGTWRAEVEGQWTRTDGQAARSTKDVTWTAT